MAVPNTKPEVLHHDWRMIRMTKCHVLGVDAEGDPSVFPDLDDTEIDEKVVCLGCGVSLESPAIANTACTGELLETED